MKKLIFINLFFICLISSAQTNNNKKIKVNLAFRAQLFKPNQFGEHSLAKSHNAKLGWGLNLSFLEYNNFRLSTGFDYSQYEVKETEKVGNFFYSNYSSFNINLGYEINLNKNITFTPTIGYGDVSIYQRKQSQSYGTQNGNEFRLGLITDYKLNNTLSLFLNTTYIYSSLNINTAPEYVNYFGKSKQLQVGIGLKIK